MRDNRERVSKVQFDAHVQEWLRDISDPTSDSDEIKRDRKIATAWAEMDYVISEGATA